jgi:hypothetical protein
MARKCGVCGLAPREGEEMRPIRLRTEEDLEASAATELGLYSSCAECVDKHRARVAKRSNGQFKTPESIPNHALM